MTTQVIEESRNNRAAPVVCDENRSVFTPSVDVMESENEYIAHIDVPGASECDINVEFDQGVLTVHAGAQDRSFAGANQLVSEYEIGDFHRTFRVDEQIDAGKITAKYTDGVLTLHLPKVAATVAHKIPVTSN